MDCPVLYTRSLAGDGSIDESGLFRSGSEIVHSFWDEWERTVTADADQLVVVGISAGTMAVLNHFDRILQVASSSNNSSSSNSTNNSSTSATQLRIILDSPDFGEEVGSQAGQTIQTFADAHIDPKIHPLCHRNVTNSSAFNAGAIDLDLISDLPCCASVHCLMRNEPTLSSWARGDLITGSISNDQVMLLLDSSFDTISILSELSLPSASPQNGGRMPSSSGSTSMISDFTTLAWDVGGIAGQSRTRLLETVQNVLRGAQQQQSPRIRWGLSSAIGHPFLLDSFDLALARFNGTSIQTLISSINNIKSANSNKEEEDEDIPNLEALFPIRNVAIHDTCAGPNYSFVPLPIGLQVTLAVVFFSLPVLAGLMGFKKSSNHNQANKNTDTVSARNDYVDAEEAAAVGPGEDEVQRKTDPGEGQSVFVKDLNVTTDSGQRILQDVSMSINLKGSTFTGLLGLSGSGKSTLMSVLAQQVPNDLGISADSISTLSDIPTTLLRQADVVDFEMMTPFDYLISTAEIYDTSKKDIDDVLQLVRPFFTVRTEKLAEGGQGVEEKVVLDPFTDNLVGRLSGGQRKMLAIAAALFNSPKLLLLDEPLSGLDSSSSERVCDLLRDIATHKAMTILMIIHQPSNDLLMKMDGVIVMCKGRVLLEKEVENIGTDFTPAEYVHTILENYRRDVGSYLSDVNRMSMELIGSIEPKELELQEQNKITRLSPMKHGYVMPWKNIRLRQVQPLVKRMQLENGSGWKDLLVLPACFALITAWLRFESGSPIQVYLATTLFIIVPTITFQPRLIVICNNFRAHAFELEDKRVSSVAFLIASAIFAYGIPVVAIILGILLGRQDT
ncbi:ABC transporter ATP-binding protein [Skeletonema marinoi]|uniref:ABC transporter ATP-binding protein n=1 Tax=Skeletonema marinoi TaxID=267567 RepID=A0AAD9DB38_9STRA|nr:ABC transporter ATP-binding protein [Skeletonema marinoi]